MHVWQYHMDGRYPFECKRCTFGTFQQVSMQSHLRQMHPALGKHNDYIENKIALAEQYKNTRLKVTNCSYIRKV